MTSPSSSRERRASICRASEALRYTRSVRAELVEAPFFCDAERKNGPSTSSGRTGLEGRRLDLAPEASHPKALPDEQGRARRRCPKPSRRAIPQSTKRCHALSQLFLPEERRGGKECVRDVIPRWSPHQY